MGENYEIKKSNKKGEGCWKFGNPIRVLVWWVGADSYRIETINSTVENSFM